MSDIKLLVCGDVSAPKRNFGDAGIDFFTPNYTKKFIEDLRSCNEDYIDKGRITIDEEGIHVASNADVKFPLYVKSKFPENRALLAVNKSGIATKQKFLVGACLVDSLYQQTIHANLFNVSQDWQTIKYGQKIVQFVPIKLEPNGPDVYTEKEISSSDFYDGIDTHRGAGFGSSGI